MRANLIKKELKEARLVFVVALIFLVFTAILIQVSYPIMKEISKQPIPKSPLLPGDLSQQLNLLTDYKYYVWSQWFPKNLLQALLIVALIFGASALAGEKSRKTWEFLLSKPFSRREVFLYNAKVRLLVLLILTLISSLIYYLVLGFFKTTTFSLWPGFLLGSLAVYALMAMVFSLGLLFSAFSSRPLYAGGFSFFVVLVFSILSSLLAKKLPAYLNLLPNLTAYEIFSSFNFPVISFLLAGFLAIALQLVALFFWEKQDLL